MSEYQDILKRLEPERIAIINDCINRIQNKNEMEIIGIVTDAAKRFSASGRPMSDDERKALIYAMRDNLEGDQKKKFNVILNMMGMK